MRTETYLEKYLALGLKDVTTQKQAKNGTRMYRDPETEVHYATFSTGYVRKQFRRVFIDPKDGPNAKPFVYEEQWRVINKSKKVNRGPRMSSSEYVLIKSPAERMQRIIKEVLKDRDKHEKQAQERQKYDIARGIV